MALLMKKNINKDEQADTKALVARYARGNVALQRGRYVTAEEKKARKEKVLSMKFA